MISLIITVVILGFALYMVETYVPMSPPLKMLLKIHRGSVRHSDLAPDFRCNSYSCY